MESKLFHGFVKTDVWISLICYMDLSKLRHGFFKVITFSRFLHGFVKVATHGFTKVLVLVLVSILDYSNGVKGNCFMPPRKYFSLWKKKIFAKLYWEIWENPIAELLGNIFAQLAIFVIPLLKCSSHLLKDTEKYWKYKKKMKNNNWQYWCSLFWSAPCILWKIPKNTENTEKWQLAIFVIPLLKCSLHSRKYTKK